MIVATRLDIGGFASSIGGSSNAAANLVLNHGGLRYNGGDVMFTDRAFTLGTGEDAGILVADGNRLQATVTIGVVGLSPAIAFQGEGARTLTLAGANRGDNQFNLVLGDGLADANGVFETSLTKMGNGTWVLGRTNTYSGETKVLAGVLAVTANGALGVTGKAKHHHRWRHEHQPNTWQPECDLGSAQCELHHGRPVVPLRRNAGNLDGIEQVGRRCVCHC